MATEHADLVVTHAAELITARTQGRCARGSALGDLEVIPDGAVAIRGDRIVAVGPTGEVTARVSPRKTIDASGRLVSPGLIDPHTHAVYAGSRHTEWERRVTGTPNADLGGGIRTTLESTRRAAEQELRRQAHHDLDRMLCHGTTTVEIKSGYGQDRETELKLLRIIASLTHDVEVVPTYLAMHVVPPEHRHDRHGYVTLATELLPEACRYAEYVDVAVDPISFTTAECEVLVAAARGHGFRLRVHADQTADAGGAEFAARHRATSADHLDETGPAGVAALAASDTVGVILPGVTLHMLETTPEASADATPARSNRPLWARHLVDSGAALALSTDYNPGTSPTWSMQMIMQLAARLYRLSYAEIWHMATINAAAALDRERVTGSLAVGKRADVLIWQVPEHGMPIHRFGTNLVDTVITRGRVAIDHGRPADRTGEE